MALDKISIFIQHAQYLIGNNIPILLYNMPQFFTYKASEDVKL